MLKNKDFYKLRRKFKAQSYSFGYELQPRKVDSYSRKSIDKSYTYEIEIRSRIQQNDYIDYVALEKIKKEQKNSNVIWEKCLSIDQLAIHLKSSTTN